ncbi:redox-sensitive transcriptional activator SoxR [Solicola gregarius]|uniref:redox-sensitive transcriptional activator SoxR n=1 Tax=Solicola gregarius TaxID=2908642 RepID=UPI0038CD4F59
MIAPTGHGADARAAGDRCSIPIPQNRGPTTGAEQDAPVAVSAWPLLGTADDQRRYARDVVRRIAVIQAAQPVGIPPRSVADALPGLPDERTPTCDDWEHLSAGWRAELDAGIDQLVRPRDRLTDCIGFGCLSIDACARRNTNDRLGDVGPGPRRLLTRGLATETKSQYR